MKNYIQRIVLPLSELVCAHTQVVVVEFHDTRKVSWWFRCWHCCTFAEERIYKSVFIGSPHKLYWMKQRPDNSYDLCVRVSTFFFFLSLSLDINSAATAAKWVYIVCAFARFSRLPNVSMSMRKREKLVCMLQSDAILPSIWPFRFFFMLEYYTHTHASAKRMACILHTQYSSSI